MLLAEEEKKKKNKRREYPSAEDLKFCVGRRSGEHFLPSLSLSIYIYIYIFPEEKVFQESLWSFQELSSSSLPWCQVCC